MIDKYDSIDREIAIEDAFFMKLGGHVGSLITFIEPIQWFETNPFSFPSMSTDERARVLLLIDVLRECKYTHFGEKYKYNSLHRGEIPKWETVGRCNGSIQIIPSQYDGDIVMGGAPCIRYGHFPKNPKNRNGTMYRMRCFIDGEFVWFYAWKPEIIFL